jgi:hypothetical protein
LFFASEEHLLNPDSKNLPSHRGKILAHRGARRKIHPPGIPPLSQEPSKNPQFQLGFGSRKIEGFFVTVSSGFHEKLKEALKTLVIDLPPGNEGRWKGIFPLCNPQVFPIHIQEESDQNLVHFWPKDGHDMARNEHQARFVFLVPWRFGLIYSDY